MKRFNYLFQTEDTTGKSNTNFMYAVCDVCGRKDTLCMSRLSLTAGYGSEKYDGEELVLDVCGDCIDKAFDYVLESKGSDCA